MTESDDDLTAALRRELAGAAVPYDDDRADAMIRTATAADPIGARSWQAPLAAAAAVLVVGGGAAVLATARNGSGYPSGDGGLGCPETSMGTVTAADPSVPPFTTYEPPPSSATDVPSQSTTPYAPPKPRTTAPGSASGSPTSSGPTSTGPTSSGPTSSDPTSSDPTSTPTTSASPATPCAAPSESSTSDVSSLSAVYPPPPSAFTTSSSPSARAAPTTTVVTAGPGEQESAALTLPAPGSDVPYVFMLRKLSGRSGTISGAQGSDQRFSENLADMPTTQSPAQGAASYSVGQVTDPYLVTLDCTDTIRCSVQVSVFPIALTGPTTSPTPSR